MELIYEKTDRRSGIISSGILRNFEADFDISIEEDSTFEVKMAAPAERDSLLYIENEVETVLYIPGTEFGGMIDGYALDMEEGTVAYTGRTWRGTLANYIVEPPKGWNNAYVSGPLPGVLNWMPHHPLITFTGTGRLNEIKLDRYITTREAALAALSAAGTDYIIRFTYEPKANGENGGAVTGETMERRDLRDELSLSQDYGDKVALKITRDGTTPRRLICLGEGEGKDQKVLNLYADKNWNITKSRISGAAPVAVFESSEEDLEAEGRKKFRELIDAHESVDVSISDIDIELGDRISARDNLTGESVTAIVTGIVLKMQDYGSYSTATFEYKTSTGSIIN